VIGVPAGALTASGAAPRGSANEQYQPDQGSAEFAGQPPLVSIGERLQPGAADLQIVGYGPQIEVTHDVYIGIPAGAITATGRDPLTIRSGVPVYGQISASRAGRNAAGESKRQPVTENSTRRRSTSSRRTPVTGN